LCKLLHASHLCAPLCANSDVLLIFGSLCVNSHILHISLFVAATRYHPNYVPYVVSMMRERKWHFWRLGNHSRLIVNPDGSTTLTPNVGLFAKGAHSFAMTRVVANACR
jgi:hypothetical protein